MRFKSKKYWQADLKTLILRTTSKVMYEHIDAALNAFLGSVANLQSTTSIEPHTVTQNLQESPVPEYAVYKMNYTFCHTGVLTHHLKLKKGMFVMLI